MATLHNYICPECGYEHMSNPAGYDAARRGLFFDFKCEHCKEIVSVSVSDFDDFWIDCPECGERLTSTWNPIDGSCPKCGSKMRETGEIMMVD